MFRRRRPLYLLNFGGVRDIGYFVYIGIIKLSLLQPKFTSLEDGFNQGSGNIHPSRRLSPKDLVRCKRINIFQTGLNLFLDPERIIYKFIEHLSEERK